MLFFHLFMKNWGCVLCWKHCHSFVDTLHLINEISTFKFTLTAHLNVSRCLLIQHISLTLFVQYYFDLNIAILTQVVTLF